MKWLMRLLGIGPGLTAMRDETDRRVYRMSDDEKFELLRRFCAAYAGKDPSAYDVMKLDKEVRSIGNILRAEGGHAKMKRWFDRLGSIDGTRSLELHWEGIGDWQAWIPACEFGDSTVAEQGILMASIVVDGQPVEAEFFNGVIWTGQQRKDLAGNFDLSIRVAERIPVSALNQNLFAELPWGEGPARFDVIASGPIPGGLSHTLVTDEPAPWLDASRETTPIPDWADLFWSANSDDVPIGRLLIQSEP